jgi:hypothetical protein
MMIDSVAQVTMYVPMLVRTNASSRRETMVMVGRMPMVRRSRPALCH